MKSTPLHPTILSPHLHQVTLNTGQIATHELQKAPAPSATEFLPLLDRCRGQVPSLPGFDFVFSEGNHCCQFILYQGDCELVTGGVAWGPGEGDILWRWLDDYYDSIFPWVPGRRISCLRTPPPLPWVAEVRTLHLGLISPEQLQKVAVVGRDVALALIQRSLTRN